MTVVGPVITAPPFVGVPTVSISNESLSEYAFFLDVMFCINCQEISIKKKKKKIVLGHV